MPGKVCPCNGCVPPKRTIWCHSNCPDYDDWREWKDAINRIKREQMEEESFYNCVTSKRFVRGKK
jgi:hypothetical protein